MITFLITFLAGCCATGAAPPLPFTLGALWAFVAHGLLLR